MLSHAAPASAGPQCAVHHHMAMQKPVLHEMAARYLLHHNQFFSDWCAIVRRPPYLMVPRIAEAPLTLLRTCSSVLTYSNIMWLGLHKAIVRIMCSLLPTS